MFRADDGGGCPCGGLRVDFARSWTTKLARPRREGNELVVEGVLARADDVYPYADAMGITFEFRPREEIFDAASLRTLRGVALLEDHPPGRMYDGALDRRIGRVRDGRADSDQLVVVMAIADAGVADRVTAGELVELSGGYRAVIEPTPGVAPDGRRYDSVQRHIEYDHVALLEPGRSRCGDSCTVRVDGQWVSPHVIGREPPPQIEGRALPRKGRR